QGRDGVQLRHWRETRIGILRRDTRQRQNTDQVHDAAQQHACDNREQQPDHGHPTVAMEGIGASRWVRVATPTGVSYSRSISAYRSIPPVGSQLPARDLAATLIS